MSPLTQITAAATAICLAVGSPVLAQGKGNGKGHAKQKHRTEQVVRGCPPGLAKKSPACVPPGQAKKRVRADDDRHYRINVGSRLDRDDYVIVRPWQYGLEPAPGGSRYAVYDGVLVRIDEDTAEVLDLIRAVGAVAN
ncbi:RcnB family protein [Vannielia litorea]|uniref:RcnB family protein n=1 Tax=Vannielia litorea TaxID=1217970 RepID=UPI0021BDB567|nr:RcnB family protein [Vannielia litorea]